MGMPYKVTGTRDWVSLQKGPGTIDWGTSKEGIWDQRLGVSPCGWAETCENITFRILWNAEGKKINFGGIHMSIL